MIVAEKADTLSTQKRRRDILMEYLGIILFSAFRYVSFDVDTINGLYDNLFDTFKRNI